jgi:hypothetical protein
MCTAHIVKEYLSACSDSYLVGLCKHCMQQYAALHWLLCIVYTVHTKCMNKHSATHTQFFNTTAQSHSTHTILYSVKVISATRTALHK